MKWVDLTRLTGAAIISIVAALASLAPQGALAQSSHEHPLPLVTPASNRAQEGFVRIINHSIRAGTVEIHAVDDSGQRFGPVTLDIAAKATKHFNSGDLESGNNDKGLSGGVGDGEGNWRLELRTTLDIEPLVYIRTQDGFLTSLHDTVEKDESMRYHVPFFNPGSNNSQVSQLRIINASDTENEVTIIGFDDDGDPEDAAVRLTLPANGARTITAQELEGGGSGLTGGFGDGKGKWHLFVSSSYPIRILNLLRSPTGNLANLSTSTIKRADSSTRFAPVNQATFDARFVGQRMQFPDLTLEVVSSGRFRLTIGSSGHTGLISYENTGPNSGLVKLDYDLESSTGYICLVSVLFDSLTSGTGAWFCTGSSKIDPPVMWHIRDASMPDAPDLVVQSPSVNNADPSAGQTFTLRVTVRNQGVARAVAATLRYFRSPDSTISTSDVEVGTDAVSGLSPAGTSNESISLTAPSNVGTYYYGACVDVVSGESDTENNCSSAVRVTVRDDVVHGGACMAGLIVNPGGSCTYKSHTFSVSSSGQGSIAFFRADESIRNSGTINGVQWDFHASRNSGSNSWTIHRAN